VTYFGIDVLVFIMIRAEHKKLPIVNKGLLTRDRKLPLLGMREWEVSA
jgi:hypothetical protein